jgi:hypothetical protein
MFNSFLVKIKILQTQFIFVALNHTHLTLFAPSVEQELVLEYTSDGISRSVLDGNWQL